MYPPDQVHQPRSTRDVLQWARQAERDGKPKYGVKGVSVLARSIDIVKAIPIDYMHAVLEGVTKSLMAHWFDTKYHHLRFYLHRQLKEIDKMLLRIKPPYDVPRVPQSIASSLKYWKASEYCSWLLFYSLPILKYYLPPDYVYHLALLVSAMHILLSAEISSDHLSKANQMLHIFYQLIPSLYRKELCTINVHSLIHLTSCVQRWGPLWSYSCFGFENMNGFLKKHCHGTRNVIPQMVRALHTRQSLPSLKRRLDKNETNKTLAFLQRVSLHKDDDPYPPADFLGRVKIRAPTDEEKRALSEAGFEAPATMAIYPRCRVGRLVIHARTSSREKVRDNSICSVRCTAGDENQMTFGSVQLICCFANMHVAIICLFEHTYEGVLSDLPAANHPELAIDNLINLFVYKVKKLSLSNKTIAIAIEHITEKCIHIPVKYSPTDFIVKLPNTFEHH